MAGDTDGPSGGGQQDSALTRRRLLLLIGGATGSAVGTAIYLYGFEEEEPPDSGPTTPSTREPRQEPPLTRSPEQTERSDGSKEQDFIYNTASEMAAIKRKVNEGMDPWATGYRFLQRGGKRAMEMSPRSVVDKTTDNHPPHRFVARVHERDDYWALKEMSDAVLDLGMLHYFTEDDQYAERAIDLIYHWCLDPETYMTPNGDALNVGPELRLHILAPKMWWGASFLRGHQYWGQIDATMPWEGATAEDGETAFRKWVRALMESMPPAGYAMRNNHWSWRLAFYSSAAAYLEEDDLLKRIFDVWTSKTKVPKGHTVLNLDEGEEYYPDKNRPWNDYERHDDGEGYMRAEINREEAYFYTVFNLEALSLTAEIARVRNVDLYSYNAPTDPDAGSTMQKLFNFMIPYAKDPSDWQWGNGPAGIQSGDWQRCKTVFELASSEWPLLKEAITGGDLQRPFHSFYIMRHPTLTHADRFALDT